MAERVSAQGVACLVVDPVLISTSGHSLGDSDVARALVSRRGLPLPASCMQHTLFRNDLLARCTDQLVVTTVVAVTGVNSRSCTLFSAVRYHAVGPLRLR